MAKRELHAKAIELRKQGMSYSRIKKEIGVSKSALSEWLRDMPLSRERVNEFRANSEVRIEKYRASREKTRNHRRSSVYQLTGKEIGEMTERELFIAGLFLYWGEGGKTKYTTLMMANTDPSVLVFFKTWLISLGANESKIKVRVQLYSDMDTEAEMTYWSTTLNLPRSAFRAPYIKSSNRLNLTYKQRFTHGTCNVIYDNRDIAERILLGVEWLRESLIAGVAQI